MEVTKQKQNPYRTWAFRLFIYLIIINATIIYLVINFADGFHDVNRFVQNTNILGVIANVILVAGIICAFLSHRKKEIKNYQFYVSSIGFLIFLSLTLVFMIKQY